MRSLHFVALVTLAGYAGAQTPLPDPPNGVLDRKMAWTVSVILPGNEAAQPHLVTTMKEALNVLDAHELDEAGSAALIAFMDSAAVELHRIGTPTMLFWCDEVAKWKEKIANEKACGCSYVCFQQFGRALIGVIAFNERTRALLEL
ncbi:MAG: hypothetical protein IPJ76_14880 [Flavobacteriales bacterium]|nr:MAG: hypothetical protein IPJ76_14880 [Flavobacteriales bacterium]